MIKTKKSKRAGNDKIIAKRMAASTLEQDREFESSLFDSFHRKTLITKILNMKDTKKI